MPKLYFPLRRAQLFEFTEYTPVKCNDTGWSSMDGMHGRYVLARGHLPKLNIPDLKNVLLGRKESQEVDRILETMRKLNFITLKLQRDDATISQVCCFFDTPIDFISELCSRLTTTSSIVKSNVFKSAIVKIELEQKLSAAEKQAVKVLEVDIEVLSKNEEEPESVVDAAMKRFRENQQSIKSSDVDMLSICPSPNRCNRLFCRKASVLSFETVHDTLSQGMRHVPFR